MHAYVLPRLDGQVDWTLDFSLADTLGIGHGETDIVLCTKNSLPLLHLDQILSSERALDHNQLFHLLHP